MSHLRKRHKENRLLDLFGHYNGESNRKAIESYILLLGSVFYNYILLLDFDHLLFLTCFYFKNQTFTYCLFPQACRKPIAITYILQNADFAF